ncbi:site-2 protease family protein [Candidatus Saccharibacteria bacterium]|nr:site-2 protease family protein [Candidatus Saccharibacteria bacterium]
MNIVLGVIVGLIVLMVLVTLHEAGHFVAARRNGVRVLEFGIGFPPRAVAWIRENGKWRRLKKSEWDKSGITKTVLSEDEGKANKSAAKSAKSTKKSGKKSEKTQALTRTTVTVKKREKLIVDGLVFSINWLPIGGFCQMDGESATDTREGTFGKAGFLAKTKILFAGVAMNWLVGFVILTVLAWTGMPIFLNNQFTVAGDTTAKAEPVKVVEVVEGSPAAKAGFLVGDQIVKAGDTEVMTSSEVREYNSRHAAGEATYTVIRFTNCVESPELEVCEYNNNASNFESPEEAEKAAYSTQTVFQELTAQLNSSDDEYLLGIMMESAQPLRYSTWSAPVVGAGLTLQITGETFKGLGELLWNLVSGLGRLFSFDSAVRESGQAAISQVGDSVSGPVGIIGVLFPTFTEAGPTNLAFLAALISISLACMNVLPIPALDGGRWLLIAIYKLRKKPLTRELEQKIVARSMYVLLGLMAVVTVLDITRFF